MSEETKGWTFTADDGGTYAVEKFTDQMKLAFNLLLETDKELRVAQKTAAKLEMALRGFNSSIASQLTKEMLVEEKKPEPLESMD
jgi:endonuclease V-like protein UPF0215 family